jgi:S1-C subfamily serine protease
MILHVTNPTTPWRQSPKLGSFCGTVLVWLMLIRAGAAQEATVAQQAMPTGLEQLQAAVLRAIDRAEESVVAIGRGRMRAEGQPDGDEQPSFFEYATGVIIDGQGLILTNYHLLGDVQASQYVVWLPGARQFSAKVKAADPWTDLAILEVAADHLRAMPLGQAENLKKGEFVVVLGNPYAIVREGSVSASWGLVSNLRARPMPTVEPSGARAETVHQHGGLIETDARLKLGTSGGPLINLRGEMVGLSTTAAAIFGYDVSASYAIPVDAGFRRVLDVLKAGEEAEFGFLGVQVDPLASTDSDQAAGVRVGQIVRATPAAASRLRFRDVITHVDARPVQDTDDFLRQIGLRAPADSVELTILRQDGLLGRSRPFKRTVILSKRYVARSRPAIVTAERSDWRGLRVDYATAIPDLLGHLDQIDPKGCVAAIDVRPDSLAWQAGLRPSMFVSHVEQRRVDTPAAFLQAVGPYPAAVDLKVTGPAGALTLEVPGAQADTGQAR